MASIVLVFSVLILFLGYSLLQNFFLKEIVLEDVTNLPVEEAVAKLEKQGLRVDASATSYNDKVEEDHVLRQSPVAGSVVNQNDYVRLTVSLGKMKDKMPSVVGLPEQTALRLLTGAKYKDENIDIVTENHPDVQAGYIIRQVPEPEEKVVPEETEITLFVSKGKEKFEMPNLIGLSKEEAEAVLTRHNLTLEKVEEDFSELPAGQVYRQHPIDPGQPVEAGTPIRIWVSKGFKETSKEKKEEFIIFMQDGEQANVAIFVTDETGVDRNVVQETIRETKGYKITVKVSREEPALIKVFKNGDLYERREVRF